MKAVRRITGVLLVAVLLMPLAVFAEELTLDDCIDLALKNRASIISAIGQEKAASAGRRAALGAFLPRIAGSYSYSKSKTTNIEYEGQVPNLISVDTLYVEAFDSSGASIGNVPAFETNPVFGPTSVETFTSPDQDGLSKSLSLSGSMSIFNLSNYFNYASSAANLAASKLNVLASEQDLIYGVKVAYFSFLASYENVSVQEEAVKRADEQLKLIQSRFDLGSASKSDVLKQKVQFGNDRLALLNGQNAVINARANLAYTIGVDPRKDWEFSTTVSRREYEGTMDQAIEFGLGHKPSLLVMQERFGGARNDLRSAKSLYLPTASAFASLSLSEGTRGDTVLFDQSSTSKRIGFEVSWNIFDGFLRERSVSAAKVAVNNRRAELADARNLAVSNIHTAYLDIDQLREQKTVSTENVEAAEEDLKITQEKYNLGAATILDLLDAQVSLKTAQVSLIRVEFDMNLAIAKLENAMGKM